jgi:hypothetical protein
MATGETINRLKADIVPVAGILWAWISQAQDCLHSSHRFCPTGLAVE